MDWIDELLRDGLFHFHQARSHLVAGGTEAARDELWQVVVALECHAGLSEALDESLGNAQRWYGYCCEGRYRKAAAALSMARAVS